MIFRRRKSGRVKVETNGVAEARAARMQAEQQLVQAHEIRRSFDEMIRENHVTELLNGIIQKRGQSDAGSTAH